MKKLTILIFLLFVLSCKKTADLQKMPLEISLHDYMEDYMEVVEEDYKENKTLHHSKLVLLLKAVPSMAIEENRVEWQEIVDKSIAEDELLESCKVCHRKFKKNYKNTYRKRLISIDPKMFQMPTP